jgi:ribosomal protein L11 methyltransferase
MESKQYSFRISEVPEETLEVLIAYLSASGFEGFQIEEDVLKAITEEEIETGILDEILNIPVFSSLNIAFEINNLPDINWNEDWERSYEPVLVENICAIIAPFHEKPSTEYSILIEPKMSFGTGHHETTRLMLRHIYNLDLNGKNILDMGCGTGVLGIFALMRGASKCTAIDIDEWACKNSVENFVRNGFNKTQFTVIQGDSEAIPSARFPVILANINRNILLSDMSKYSSVLEPGGYLILSGILSTDRDSILESAGRVGLSAESELNENNWLGLRLVK